MFIPSQHPEAKTNHKRGHSSSIKHRWLKQKIPKSVWIAAAYLSLISQRRELLICISVQSLRGENAVTSRLEAWWRRWCSQHDLWAYRLKVRPSPHPTPTHLHPDPPAQSTYMYMSTHTWTHTLLLSLWLQRSAEEGSSLSPCCRFISWHAASDFIISVAVS